MHVRRALLLFAIVLGLAALAAAVSQPRRETSDPPPDEAPAPTVRPAQGAPTASSGDGASELVFPVEGPPRTRRLEVGRSATVLVQVARPGEVTIESLGLLAPADALTPARFDVLGREPGRHRVRFAPAGTSEPAAVGTLAIVAD